MSTKIAKWIGIVPTNCDVCKVAISDTFVDGKTQKGPWANMCPECHQAHGIGFGVGQGQKYQRQSNGDWNKVTG